MTSAADKLAAGMLEQAAQRRKTQVSADSVLGLDLGASKEVELPIDKILPGRFQPRTKLDPQWAEELAEHIREVGLNSPIVVREIADKPGFYELIAGENRLEAYKLIGNPTIPAIIRHMDDAAAAKAALADNIMRRDITDFEIANGLKMLKDNGIETTISGLARVIGKSRADVHRYLSFFDLPPDSIKALRDAPDALGGTHAQCIAEFAKQGHHTLVTEAIQLIIDKKLTQSRAVSWIETRLQLKTVAPRYPVRNKNGVHVGYLIQGDKRLQFKPEAGVDISECMRLIADALSNVEKAENQPTTEIKPMDTGSSADEPKDES